MNSFLRPKRSVLTEEQGAHAGSEHVEGGGQPGDVAGRDADAGPLLADPAGDGADDRHLEPVEDPHGAEADDHLPVKA